ncbi:MAG: hypothetical protein Unbinned400contig1002_14 [Prokaryotic dsDNA virus sp.]|nr:MAG: hypothetical protein Unbinned400contig1002_14 [Prokaryotic dsDNA virus sp.]|tara:strand:+ start:7209 stop:7523 length:315 start_codon:yes stop_codon:yes gene_type:complete
MALGKLPHILIQRRNVGTFYTRAGTPITIGHPGEPDLQGVIGNQRCPNCEHPIHPKPFGIEVKGTNGRMRLKQKLYRDNVAKRLGIIYIVARSVAQAIEGLDIE